MKRRLLIGVALFLTCLGAGGLAYRYYPRTITSSSDLESNVGNRVRLTAIFDGDSKESDYLHFDGTKVAVQHLLGAFESPDTGQTIDVTGRLRRVPYYAGVSYKYSIDDARWSF